MKKFEEGIFSDLRNLKPGVDASLEEPKVSFFFPMQGQYENKWGGGKRKPFSSKEDESIPLYPPPSLPWLPAQNTEITSIPGGTNYVYAITSLSSIQSFSFPLFFLLPSSICARKKKKKE